MRDAVEGRTASLYSALLRDLLTYAGHHNIRARMPHSFIVHRLDQTALIRRCLWLSASSLVRFHPGSVLPLCYRTLCSHNSFSYACAARHSHQNFHPEPASPRPCAHVCWQSPPAFCDNPRGHRPRRSTVADGLPCREAWRKAACSALFSPAFGHADARPRHFAVRRF